MNKAHVVTNTLFAAACAILVSSKSFAEPTNLSQLKAEIKAYHDQGTYQKEVASAINDARRYITERLKTNKQSQLPKKLAIVLDIDETCLSNYDKMLARDFGGNHATFHQDNLIANAPAINPMLELYREAAKNHVAVFFITGRPQSEYQATDKNLKAAGYQQWAGLYLRPENYRQKSIMLFKSQTRAMIAQKGYTIIASIGDQESDLRGGFTEKTFKLPNPYYHIP